MHFEILVEDISGKKALDILIPKIVGEAHTFKVISYKGVGRIPRDIGNVADPSKRILLNNLPRLLSGYGKAFASYPADYKAVVVFICDLDNKNLKTFRAELDQILNNCDPKPETSFCLAIEEGEAWFLGDITAVKLAYPKAKDAVLNSYTNDSICGTWEVLANAVYPGGSQSLSSQSWHKVGAEKSNWAEKISPHMDISINASPSFCYLREKILSFVDNA